MKSFFQRAAWISVFLLSAGCAQTPSWMSDMPSVPPVSSWFDGWFGSDKTVAQEDASSQAKTAYAPPPDPAPVAPVMVQPMPPPPPVMQKVRVAVLLPLTGPDAALGHAMLNAAQQAVFDAAAPNFELMPRDTGSAENTAQLAARDAVASGAQMLIGPLFAAQIPAVSKVATQADIPVLSLSTDTSLAAPNLYVMGFAPGAQAERVARFAISRGLKRFAALVPGNSYGAVVGQAFQVEVAKDGGAMVALGTYDPVRHDSDVQARDIADKSGVIDAVFLPEGGSDLALITKQLAAAGVDPQKVHLLGTGLWDTPDMGRVAPLAVGGWYAAPDPASRQNFVTSYKAAYGDFPPRLTTLAYDATALAAALAKRGARYDVATMTSANGFAGLDGIFRLKNDGEVERGLAILEVSLDGAHVIDPALTSFVAAK